MGPFVTKRPSLVDVETVRKRSCSPRVLGYYDDSRKMRNSGYECWSHFGETEVSRDALAFEATSYWCLMAMAVLDRKSVV